MESQKLAGRKLQLKTDMYKINPQPHSEYDK